MMRSVLVVAVLAVLAVGVSAQSSPCATQGGVCQANTIACTGGTYFSSLCPGAANVQCCKRNAAPSGGGAPSSPCSTQGGKCLSQSAGCGGGSNWQSGLCPGAADVKCCMPPAPCTARPGAKCMDPNVAGACKGDWLSGIGCAANTKCCIPWQGECGPYSGLSGSPIQGNGGQTFLVTPIVKDHLTDPSMFGLPADEKDNNMEINTACAYNKLYNAAKAAGFAIRINSGFRTIKRQQYLYDCMNCGCCNDGNLAAFPGSSNHGIGKALDLDVNDDSYNWMADNAQKFGFIRTVPSEDWHWEFRPNEPRSSFT